MSALVVAGLLLGHALVHASYLMPAPAPKPDAPAWPFRLEHSWLLDRVGIDLDASRVLGIGIDLVLLWAVVVAGWFPEGLRA